MKSKLSMILFVLILGSVLTTALVSVDAFTKEPIARNKAMKLKKSVLASLEVAYTKDNIEQMFSESVETKEYDQAKFYLGKTSGDIAFEIKGMGLWGSIYGTIALSPDLELIRQINIIHQEETPGLGGRIAEAEFLNRFKGKNASGELIIKSAKATGDNEVDGITGATLSCKAFELLLNSEIKRFVAIMKENK